LSNSKSADLVIHRAVLWDGRSVAEESALAVVDGRIAALGGSELLEHYDARRVIDAEGGLVAPGFIDAHNHAAFGGIEHNRCDLLDVTSLDEIYERIRVYAQSNPNEEWILGGGWYMPAFPGGTPQARELDKIVPDRPVFLINCDHHGAWVNSKALEIAGITRDTPDPEFGRIERDEHGNPSGTLHEGAAELIAPYLPTPRMDELQAGLLTAQKLLFADGVLGWQDAILGDYGGYGDMSPVYASLADSGNLTARATGALWVARDFADMGSAAFVDSLVKRREQYERSGFTIDTAKIMVDGIPENQTAAMNEPYYQECQCAPNSGIAYFTRSQLIDVVPKLNAAGFNVHFHAIGDRAVEYALDALEAVPERVRAESRNHIAHIQIVDPKDIPRFHELNATINIQALWACGSDQNLDLTVPFIGEERTSWHYPFASIARTGAQVAAGSDWPVSSADPWQAIHVAVTRKEPGDPDGKTLVAEEAITLEQALEAYTHGSAHLLGVPGGRIAVGETADLTVANRNPFAGSADDIYLTQNMLSVLGGRVVFEREPND
jgi:predicted amidohydrolase YtcJ